MKAVAAQFAEAVPDAFQGDGVAFLQTVYKDPTLALAVRLDAAAKAARFERPMLSASNVQVEAQPVMTAEERGARIRELSLELFGQEIGVLAIEDESRRRDEGG
jgi:hypothetical protein